MGASSKPLAKPMKAAEKDKRAIEAMEELFGKWV